MVTKTISPSNIKRALGFTTATSLLLASAAITVPAALPSSAIAQSAVPTIDAGNAALAQIASQQISSGAQAAVFDLGPAPAAAATPTPAPTAAPAPASTPAAALAAAQHHQMMMLQHQQQQQQAAMQAGGWAVPAGTPLGYQQPNVAQQLPSAAVQMQMAVNPRINPNIPPYGMGGQVQLGQQNPYYVQPQMVRVPGTNQWVPAQQAASNGWVYPHGPVAAVTSPPEIFAANPQEAAAARASGQTDLSANPGPGLTRGVFPPQRAERLVPRPQLGGATEGSNVIYQAATYRTDYDNGFVTREDNGALYPQIAPTVVGAVNPASTTLAGRQATAATASNLAVPGSPEAIAAQAPVATGEALLESSTPGSVTVPSTIQPVEAQQLPQPRLVSTDPDADFRSPGETIFLSGTEPASTGMNLVTNPAPGNLLPDLDGEFDDLNDLDLDDDSGFAGDRSVSVTVAPVISMLPGAVSGNYGSVPAGGLSAELSVKLNDYIVGRLPITGVYGSGEIEEGGSTAEFTTAMIGADLLIDYHPFQNGFRLSAGPGVSFVSANFEEQGTSAGEASASGAVFTPYLGVGYDGALFGESGFSLHGEVGGHFLVAKPDLSGDTWTDTTLATSVDDGYDSGLFVPQFKVGVSFAF